MARTELAERLRDKVPELEETIYASVDSLPGEGGDSAPIYVAGLRAAIREVILLAIEAIEADDDGDRPPPFAALAQARRAARSGVPLETVLRRYAAGERAFLSAALTLAAFDLSSEAYDAVRATLGATVDGLMAAVAHEYELEQDRLRKAPDDPRFERIRRLLKGEVSLEEIAGYQLNIWHVAIVSEAALDRNVFGRITRSGGVQRLVVGAERGQTWAWLGASTSRAVETGLDELYRLTLPDQFTMGRGEPRFGMAGFCLSHQEAMIGLEAQGLLHQSIVRGAEAVLAVAVMRDSSFLEAIKASFLEPLDIAGSRAGVDLRRTVRAYLATGQNATNAAAKLGVERRTVASHIRICERAIGRTVEECHAQLQVALDVERMLAESPN
jgi:hypothetical protein